MNLPTNGVVYYKQNGWYCKAYDVEYGPYPDEADAWWIYEQILKVKACPTCEE